MYNICTVYIIVCRLTLVCFIDNSKISFTHQFTWKNVAFLYAIISYWFKIANLIILKFSLCDMCIWWHTKIFVWKSICEDVNVMHLIFFIMICVYLQGFLKILCSKSIKQFKDSMQWKIVYLRILIFFS